jgi:hypothetical protein
MVGYLDRRPYSLVLEFVGRHRRGCSVRGGSVGSDQPEIGLDDAAVKH